MPGKDRTGRLGRGKNCDEKAKADRMGGRSRRPINENNRGRGRGQRRRL